MQESENISDPRVLTLMSLMEDQGWKLLCEEIEKNKQELRMRLSGESGEEEIISNEEVQCIRREIATLNSIQSMPQDLIEMFQMQEEIEEDDPYE